MSTVITLLIMAAVVGIGSAYRRDRVHDEHRLYDRILTDYVSSVRPVVNGSGPLKVKFSFNMHHIVQLDERQQVLTTHVFIDQTWTDPGLAWDPEEFQDITSLTIPEEKVWKPDTFLYNNADNSSTGFISGTHIEIRKTGEVTWPASVRLKSSCLVKIAYFPFDYQYCMLRFGSWIYGQNLVDFSVKEDATSVDGNSFIKNSQWELLDLKTDKTVTLRSRGDESHSFLTVVIFLKRNTFFYLFNIIVPCAMLSLLTLMTFWLPPTSGEKVTLGLSVFLAFSMFMLLIAEEVPASSDAVPLIGIYLCCVMTMTSMSVICAVLVTNLHSRGSKLRCAPWWLVRLMVHGMSRVLGVSRNIPLLATTVTLSDDMQFFILQNKGLVSNTATQSAIATPKINSKKVPKTSKVCTKVKIGRSKVDTIDDEDPVLEPFIKQPSEIDTCHGSGPPNSANLRQSKQQHQYDDHAFDHAFVEEAEPEDTPTKPCQCCDDGDVWVLRDELKDTRPKDAGVNQTCLCKTNSKESKMECNITPNEQGTDHGRMNKSVDKYGHLKTTILTGEDYNRKCQVAFEEAKLMIAEWYTIAKVIDRMLFLLCFVLTILAYIIILVVLPEEHSGRTDSTGLPSSLKLMRYMSKA